MDIAETLLQQGLVTQQQLDAAALQPNGRRIDQRLIEMGLVSEEDTLLVFAELLGTRFVSLKDLKIDPELVGKFPHRDIYRHSILPLERRNGTAIIATSDPFDLEALEELSSLSGLRLEPVLARREDINSASVATRSMNSWPSVPMPTKSNCSKGWVKGTASWQKWPRRPPS